MSRLRATSWLMVIAVSGLSAPAGAADAPAAKAGGAVYRWVLPVYVAEGLNITKNTPATIDLMKRVEAQCVDHACTDNVNKCIAAIPGCMLSPSAAALKEDKLEGSKPLPGDKDVKALLTDVPDQPIETIIVWSHANPARGKAPLTVQFTADPPPAAKDPTYTWTFGEGGASAKGQLVTHTYQKPGVYRAILKVSTATGDLGEDELRIKVE